MAYQSLKQNAASISRLPRASNCRSISIRQTLNRLITIATSAIRASFPYTRGIRRNLYRGRLWTMRQYAGYATAEESNARYKYLLVARHHRIVGGLRSANADWFGF